MSLEQKVKDIIVDQLGVDAAQVTPEGIPSIRSSSSWPSRKSSAPRSLTRMPRS